MLTLSGVIFRESVYSSPALRTLLDVTGAQLRWCSEGPEVQREFDYLWVLTSLGILGTDPP